MLTLCDDICFSLAHGFRSLCMESDAINMVNSIKNMCISSSDSSMVLEVLEFFNFVGSSPCQFIPCSWNKLTQHICKFMHSCPKLNTWFRTFVLHEEACVLIFLIKMTKAMLHLC